jgi:hypothetical protein
MLLERAMTELIPSLIDYKFKLPAINLKFRLLNSSLKILAFATARKSNLNY